MRQRLINALATQTLKGGIVLRTAFFLLTNFWYNEINHENILRSTWTDGT